MFQDAASGVYYKEYYSTVSAENAAMLAQKNDFNTHKGSFTMNAPTYMIVITWNKMELSKQPRSPSEV
jgi:hypothetical protein